MADTPKKPASPPVCQDRPRHHLGHTRTSLHADHALLTPDSFVRTTLPGMKKATAIVHTAPPMGAAFTQRVEIAGLKVLAIAHFHGEAEPLGQALEEWIEADKELARADPARTEFEDQYRYARSIWPQRLQKHRVEYVRV